MKPITTRRFASFAAAAALGSGAAQAANSLYTAGDLLLFFQKEGTSNSVYVNLGNAATSYRGSIAGTVGDESLTKTNIININSSLSAAFGPGWASDTSIYAGLAAARSSSIGTGVINGDQTRTLYASRGRISVGTVGISDSPTWDLTTALPFTTSSAQIIAMGAPFDAGPDALQASFDGNSNPPSTITQYNPFLAPGIQGTAFGGFSGGVQQVGTAGEFGTYAGIGTVEFSLDLYRIVPREDSETPLVEVTGIKNIGTFEGNVVVDSFGNVSYLVPEPSSITLAGIAGLALAFRRRRND